MLQTLLFWLFFAGTGTEITREYCHMDDFNITCKNDVIIVTSAFYGRMRVGRCVPYDYEVGCSSNVLEEVGSRCSGRAKCFFRVSDTFKVRPCRIDLVPYLEASYQCVPVVRPVYKDLVRHQSSSPQFPQPSYQPNGSYQEISSSLKCYSPDSIEVITLQTGYLSGSVAATTGHGTEECPWRIHVSKGQRIKVHLFDFSNLRKGAIPYLPNNVQNASFLPSSGKASLSSSSSSSLSFSSFHLSIPSNEQYCRILAMFRELDPITQESSGSYPLTSCHLSGAGGTRETGGMNGFRKKLVFTSKTNFVSIHLNSSEVEDSTGRHSLLFHFEVIGCAEPELVGNVVLTRKEGILGVYCNSSGERWHLVCRNGSWVGSYSNCSEIGQYQRSQSEEIFLQRKKMSLGLLVAVSVGILVGIISGFILLVVIFVCRKKLPNGRAEQSVLLVDYDNKANSYKVLDTSFGHMLLDPTNCSCNLQTKYSKSISDYQAYRESRLPRPFCSLQMHRASQAEDLWEKDGGRNQKDTYGGHQVVCLPCDVIPNEDKLSDVLVKPSRDVISLSSQLQDSGCNSATDGSSVFPLTCTFCFPTPPSRKATMKLISRLNCSGFNETPLVNPSSRLPPENWVVLPCGLDGTSVLATTTNTGNNNKSNTMDRNERDLLLN